MACVICGKGEGFFGGNIAFTCPVCHAKVCDSCAQRHLAVRTSGGWSGDKHMEISCPSCHSVINAR